MSPAVESSIAAETERVRRIEDRMAPRRPPDALVRAGQRLLEPLTLRFEADHLLRDPLDYLSDVGFEVEEVERSKWGIVERVSARKSQ